MNDTKSVYFQKSEDTAVINNETGEVIAESHSHTEQAKLPVEPPFVKVYLDCLAKFKDVQFSFNPILLELLKKTTFADEEEAKGGQILYLNKQWKLASAKKCNVNLKRVEQARTEFVKKGYFYRTAVATYQLNSDIFGKGHWKDIYKVRTIQANFDFGAGTVVANIVKDEEQAMDKATEKIEDNSKIRLTELQKKNA